MAQVPGFQTPDTPPVQRSNSRVIWIVVIVCLAGFCIVALLIGAAILFPVFSQARYAAQTTKCLSNVKQLNLGALMYAAENNDRFPDARDWYDRTTKMMGVSKPVQCPTLVKQDPNGIGYALNKSIANRQETSIADTRDTILLFESIDTGRNVAGGLEQIPIPGRHGTGASASSNFGYVDGSARKVKTGVPPGRWSP